MINKIALLYFGLLVHLIYSQEYAWEQLDYEDLNDIETRATVLAEKIIQNYYLEDKEEGYDHLFRLHIATKQYENSNKYLDSLHTIHVKQLGNIADVIGIHYRITNLTRIASKLEKKSFESLFEKVFFDNTLSLAPEAKNYLNYYFTHDTTQLITDLRDYIEKLNVNNTVSQNKAIEFVEKYVMFETYNRLGDISKPLVDKIEKDLYHIYDSLLIKTSTNSEISALVVRSKKINKKLPTILRFSIYPNEYDLTRAKEIANSGYNGVIAYTRGKKNSPNETDPFKYDGRDVNKVIEWISKQHWSDGQVGMYGGSYLGFTQWSALKNHHSALKTIVPQVAVGTGIDYPMHNGVFMSYMLKWIQYVTNNKLTDNQGFGDSSKWQGVYKKWYESGKSFRALDSIEGNPNPIFQEWLDHPDFDSYWQSLTISGKEFSKVDIPVLTFTGYYDDDQIGALYYYKEHQKHHKNPNHYLVIGPYDHYGAQGYPNQKLMGYTIDSVANINIDEIVFEWFDHVLKDSLKPNFLKSKVNFQVMGVIGGGTLKLLITLAMTHLNYI